MRLEATALPTGLTPSWPEQSEQLSDEECLPLSLSLSRSRLLSLRLSFVLKIGGSMLTAPLTTNHVGNLFFCRLLLRRQTATRVVNYVRVRIMLLRLNN